MSKFSDYFERENLNEIQFESDSFYPILETAIIISLIYFSYKLILLLISNDSELQNSKEYLNCQCSICKKRFKKIIKKNHKNKHTRLYIIILIILFYFSKKYYDIIIQNQSKIKTFDPYDILQVNVFSDKKEIKKAYKNLALQYHPDKNQNDINAKNKFMLINKAYETLINEEAKKNYELYGNPDGPSPMRVSIGMPSFILNKNNHKFIMILFILIICLIIPYYFLKWYNTKAKFWENGILNSTKDYYKNCTNLNCALLDLPFILGNSEEFNLIPEPHIKSEIIQINNLYDKYKNIFRNKEILEKIGYSISLNKKKAIGIAYEYSFCDKTDKNYLKLHKLNEYILLLSKLLNLFIDSQIEKLFQLKFLKKLKETQNNKKEIDEELLKLQPIKEDFIISSLIYQQCFYQGISAYLAKNKYIPYIQLPHISLKNYNSLKEKEVDVSFPQFLSYGDEAKKTFIKKIFNFNDSETKDIIESTKNIPQYEFKIKAYVDGFDDTEFVVGDKVTFKLDITRKNEENKRIGVQHSKYFPGLFKEFLYILVFNNKNLIKLDKIFINKKENEYKFTINLGAVGIIPIKMVLMSGGFFMPNGIIQCQVKCIERSVKREELIKNIEDKNEKEKFEPSFIQKMFFNYQDSSDDDEEEEDNKIYQANDNKEEEKEINKDNQIINNIEINNEIENE